MGMSGRGKRTGAKTSAGPKKGTAKTATKNAAAKKTTKPSAAKKPAKPAGDKTSPWAYVFTPRAPGERRYWLVKSEPDTFSFDDLLAAKDRTTHWDGVRNFAARNFMRDGMKAGDQVFYYHSSTNPQAIVGIAEVAREAYPDHTAFDKSHHGYDEDSKPDDPTWYMVDLRAVEPLARPVTLTDIKGRRELAGMVLLRIGRLSVTPVTAQEWETIRSMGS
jgi:predicted RNA-binding protein with PUA-like domain